MIRNKKGFTLVELLAVIVILAVILVIAVPQIIKTIDSARNGAFSSSAKLIATTAEKEYLARKTIGDTSFEHLTSIPCEDVVETNNEDYEKCTIMFDENGNATVQLKGKGKFSERYICNGTRKDALISSDSCEFVKLEVRLDGGTDNVDYLEKYEAKTVITLEPPKKAEHTFKGWVLESGRGASIDENLLTMGYDTTIVRAEWEEWSQFEKDDWEDIVSNVQSGNCPYVVGDTKEVDLGSFGKHRVRISNTSDCADNVTSRTACGFVLEFENILFKKKMNETNTTKGGWEQSLLREYINSDLYNAMPEDLKKGIILTKVISGHDTNDKQNFETEDRLYLLSPKEVYGTTFTHVCDTARNMTRQLDWYEQNGVTTSKGTLSIKKFNNTNTIWWLRSVNSYSNAYFYYANTAGAWNYGNANTEYGISPAFRIG